MIAYGLAIGITAGPVISAALLGLHRAGRALLQHSKDHPMTKRKRTPAQRLAREIQTATGRPYTECLAEAQKRIAAEDSERVARP